MENASKALLIAAGVLIAILILSLFSFLVMQMKENTSNLYADEEQIQNMKFNQKFLVYEGQGTVTDINDPLHEPLSIQDIVTIINLAKDNNFNERQKTIIKVKVNDNDWTDKDTNELLKDKDNLDKKYKCTKVEIDPSGLVKEIIISNYN